MTAEGTVDKAARERSWAADHGMRLLTWQFFCHPHALLNSSSFYTLDENKLVERNMVSQLQSTAPDLPLVFALLTHEGVQAPHIERPEAKPPRVIELKDKETALSPPATSPEIRLP